MTSAVRDDAKLRQLAEGDAAPVLAVDFQPFSAARRLSQLLGARSQGHPVFQLDPLRMLSDQRPYLPIPDLAAAFVGALPPAVLADGRALVVGHCSTAALALHIARRLAPTTDVVAIVVRPVWPDLELTRFQFAEFQKELGAAERPCPDVDGDPLPALAEMANILRGQLSELAVKRGLDESLGALRELLTGYRGWLAFLLAHRDNPVTAAEVGNDASKTGMRIEVLAGTSDDPTIPGTAADAYSVIRTPLVDKHPRLPPELADLVLSRCEQE